MKYIYTFILLILPISVICQNENLILNYKIDQLKIETPNEASFIKYIDNPIDLYSGTPDINIPLYTLRDGQIELPISFRYNSSGIKVDEEASWVGLGWNLNIGGVITCSAVGGIDRCGLITGVDRHKTLMDAMDFNKFQNNSYVNGAWATNIRDVLDYELKLNEPIDDSYKDGRFCPDVFYFSGPGFSGRFIIDFYNGRINQLEQKENLLITPILKIGGDADGVVFNPYGQRLSGFTITTTEGISHQFDLWGYKTTYIGNNIVSQTFLLTKSIYPNGQEIAYHYDKTNTRVYNYSQDIKATVPNTLRGGYYFDSYSQFTIVSDNIYLSELSNSSFNAGHEFFLKKIETTNYNVNFELTDREDLPNMKKLDRIKIYNKTDLIIKDYKLTYTYSTSNIYVADYWSRKNGSFVQNYLNEQHFTKRLKLINIETIFENNSIDKYTFYYNSKQLPRKDSFAADYWGYYNGVTNNVSFIPNLEHLQYFDYWGNFTYKLREIQKKTDLYSSVKKGNRGYDFESCQAEILTGIEYPTGGYTEFVYEPHTFIDFSLPTAKELEKGFPSTDIAIYDDNSFFAPDDLYPSQKNKFFSFNKETTACVKIFLTRGYPNRNKFTWSDMAEFRAYVVQGPTTIDISEALKAKCYSQHIQEVNYGAAKKDILSVETVVTLNKTGYIIVDLPDRFGVQNGGEAMIQLTTEIPPSDIKDKIECQGGGIRIKEINSYNSASKANILKSTHYSYIDPISNKNSGILQHKVRFYNYYPNTFDVLGEVIEIAIPPLFLVHCAGYFTDKINIMGQNCISDPYNSTPNVGYTYVQETVKSVEDSVGQTNYNFHNEEPLTHSLSVRISSPLNGKLLKKETYDVNQKLKKQEKYNYEKFVTNYYCGFTYNDNLNLFKQIYEKEKYAVLLKTRSSLIPYSFLEFNDLTADIFMNQSRFNLTQYPVNSHFIYLKNKEIVQDGITTKEEYIYDKFTSQLKEKKILVDSKDELKYNYLYPNDLNCGIYQTMVIKNMISPLIEEKVFRNNSYIGGRVTEYGVENNIIVPKRIYLSEVNNALSSPQTYTCNGVNKTIFPNERLIYHTYDSYGNPIHISKDDDAKIVYLWSYKGQYPIAEIKNATFSEVSAILNSVFGVTSANALSALLTPNEAKLKDGSLQKVLPNALVTTYTYKPLVGMLTSTDPAGITTYYDYDVFGRLKETYIYKDNIVAPANKQTIQKYEYHYKNQ